MNHYQNAVLIFQKLHHQITLLIGVVVQVIVLHYHQFLMFFHFLDFKDYTLALKPLTLKKGFQKIENYAKTMTDTEKLNKITIVANKIWSIFYF